MDDGKRRNRQKVLIILQLYVIMYFVQYTYSTKYRKDNKILNISEFARQRGKEPQAISRYVSRHPEIQKYTRKDGKTLELLPEAERLLNAVYPLPQPIEIIEDTESRRKLIQAQELIIQLQRELQEKTKLIAKAEATQILLEDKDRQLTESRERIEEEKERTHIANQRAEEAEKAAKEASYEIDRLKNRSLWERIRNV